MTWQSRKIVLTKDNIWIGKFDGNAVLDFIPLREVKKVKTKEKRVSKDKSPLRSRSFFQQPGPWPGKTAPKQSSEHHADAPASRGFGILWPLYSLTGELVSTQDNKHPFGPQKRKYEREQFLEVL